MPKWQAILNGIQIMARANDGNIETFARHDEFFVVGGHKNISRPDKDKLRKMGWSYLQEATWKIDT